MIDERPRGRLVILASFLVAFMLTAMPLPDWAQIWRPFWVAMVLMYWCMALPNRVGPGTAWFLGLLIDVLQGTLLGMNALGFALIAYLVQNSYQRLRVYPLTQQSVAVGLFLGIYLLLSLWIRGVSDDPKISWNYWMPMITSMLLWPWLFIVLRDMRRKFHVS